LALEDLPNKENILQQDLAITSICDAQYCDSANVEATIKLFFTRLKRAVGMTAQKTSVENLTLIFPSAMLRLSSNSDRETTEELLKSKSVRETIEEPIKALFPRGDVMFPWGSGERLGCGGGGGVGPVATKHDDMCGFKCQLFVSRAPKKEGDRNTLEIPDSKDDQLLDKAFVLVRIVKNLESQAKPCKEGAVRSNNSIFQVHYSLALSP